MSQLEIEFITDNLLVQSSEAITKLFSGRTNIDETGDTSNSKLVNNS
jgi:hypothetical protein